MKRPCLVGVLLILVGALCASTAQAQEWTRFRGPNGAGLSNAIFPAHWEASDFAWKTQLPGGGHSSPLLWGDKVFVTCCNDQTAECIVACIGAADGKLLWQKGFSSHTYPHNGDNSYASSTPAVDADHVYVCWSTPEELTLAALDLSGKELWRAELGAFVSQHGGGQSPIVVGDVVLLGDDQEGRASFLFGIDRNTGKIKWKTPREASNKFSPSTPCLYTPKGQPPQAIFLSKAEGVTAIDPQTGKMIWQTKGVFDARPIGSPVITSGGLIVGSCGDGPLGHDLAAVRPPTDGKPATEVWHNRDETPYITTALARGDLLFCWSDHGIVTCRRAATGQKVWQQRVPGGTFYSSPICCGDTIYNISRTGLVVAIAAADTYKLLGQTPLHEKSQATPAVVGDRMFVRTYTHLYCVMGKGGASARR
ncbi:MAG TPA: PQQ-binding-like beta-propeller repeat protein [Tepidisphaeraceae bacterium]|nr:PQQ-binding-like beta-propeller repeat protein [Tepidisphaeraceae bacterium]